jgi:hypothetical protein
VLQRKALDLMIESKRKIARDHSFAWKVFSSLDDDQSAIPIPPTTLVDHFERVMAPKDCPAASISPAFNPMFVPLTREKANLVDPFSPDELRAAVSKINMDSAPGPDGVTPKLAKDLFAFLPFFMIFLTLVNFCFVTL